MIQRCAVVENKTGLVVNIIKADPELDFLKGHRIIALMPGQIVCKSDQMLHSGLFEKGKTRKSSDALRLSIVIEKAFSFGGIDEKNKRRKLDK